MGSQERRLYTMVYELPDLLLRHTYTTGQFPVGHVFFSNTSYSRSCDSYFIFFIVFIVLLVWLFILRQKNGDHAHFSRIVPDN